MENFATPQNTIGAGDITIENDPNVPRQKQKLKKKGMKKFSEYCSSVNEGTTDNRLIKDIDNIRETLGDKQIVDELISYMSSDDLEEFVEHIKINYDL